MLGFQIKSLKVSLKDIEDHISIWSNHTRSKKQQETNSKYQNRYFKLDYNKNQSRNETMADENDLKIHCLQKVGHKFDCTSLKTPYRTGDNMLTINDSSHIDTNNEILNKNGFNICQRNADETQYDIYSSDKDESFSYQCTGRFVSIIDFDYQSIDEIGKFYHSEPCSNISQLIFEEVKNYFNCFVLFSDESLVLASENAQFYHLVIDNKEQKYLTYNLEAKLKTGDTEMFKQGNKCLIDMCLDSNENLLVLTRTMHIENGSKTVRNFSIELFNLTPANKTESCLNFKCTLFNLNSQGVNERVTFEKPLNNLPCEFNRVYVNENDHEQSVILIDNANSRINWYKKSNGVKIRSIKTFDCSQDLKSYATINDDQQIFLCKKSGLFCFKRNSSGNKSCKIKHFDSLKSCVDTCYDRSETNIIFIDSTSIYRGKIYDTTNVEDTSLVSSHVSKDAHRIELPHASNQDRNRSNNISRIDENNNKIHQSEPLFKYKPIFLNTQNSLCCFKRVLLGKDLIFILSNSQDQQRKNSVYLLDRNKLDKFRT